MSLKRYSGWEPRTAVEYDDAGRLVALVPEVEWDDTERAWMAALAEYRERVLCPCGCGYPREVAQDPMTEFRTTVPAPTRCHVRSAIVRAQKSWAKEHPDSDMDGLLWGATVRSADPSVA